MIAINCMQACFPVFHNHKAVDGCKTDNNITTWLAVKLYYYTTKYYVVGCEIPLCEHS